MTDHNSFGGVTIRAVCYLQPGFVGIEKDGKTVWCGKLEDLPTNTPYDCMIVSEPQYEEICNLVPLATAKEKQRARRGR